MIHAAHPSVAHTHIYIYIYIYFNVASDSCRRLGFHTNKKKRNYCALQFSEKNYCWCVSETNFETSEIPCQQDRPYFNHTLYPILTVSVWLAISEATPKNGCLQFLRSSDNKIIQNKSDLNRLTFQQSLNLKKNQSRNILKKSSCPQRQELFFKPITFERIGPKV